MRQTRPDSELTRWTEKNRCRRSAEIDFLDTHFENHVVGCFGLDLEIGTRDRIVLAKEVIGCLAKVLEAGWDGLSRHSAGGREEAW
jgi:hypothetical protein